jgi:hydroxypyruvate reductase
MMDHGTPASLAIRDARRLVLEVFRAALARVEGRAAVQSALAQGCPPRAAVLAIGKAADAMARGALEMLDDGFAGGLVVTKYGHGDVAFWARHGADYLESAHPVPDHNSLRAGEAVVAFVRGLPAGLPLLCLISGGASALVEHPRQGVDLALLQRANSWLLGSGLDIHPVNRVRQGLSQLKGGGLLSLLDDREVIGLYISDVAGDDPAVIGSGLLGPAPDVPLPGGLPDWLAAAVQPVAPLSTTARVQRRIIASLDHALAAAEAEGKRLDLPVRRASAPLAGEAGDCAGRLVAEMLAGPPGLYVWGGETTVALPTDPGRGGRNQHLALAAAVAMAGRHDLVLLAAGTDGTDGPTEDAGGLVDGDTLERADVEGFDAVDCLRRADAGSLLAATGDLVHTGPTGTNVTDLVIALKLDGLPR